MRTEYNIIWKGNLMPIDLPNYFHKYDHGTTGYEHETFVPTIRGVKTLVKYLRSQGIKNIKVFESKYDEDNEYNDYQRKIVI